MLYDAFARLYAVQSVVCVFLLERYVLDAVSCVLRSVCYVLCAVARLCVVFRLLCAVVGLLWTVICA